MNEDKLSQIATRSEFHDAIRAGLAQAADAGASEICLVDPDFQDWPLNERALVETLARWAASRRKLVLFAHSFDALPRSAPRFADWRRQWSHIVQCRTDPDLEVQATQVLRGRDGRRTPVDIRAVGVTVDGKFAGIQGAARDVSAFSSISIA